jgi:hypothetical protein
MKKIFVVIGICIVLAAMPMTSAVPLFHSKHLNIMQKHVRPTLTNGTFTGEFSMKNESGYIPLGEFSGTFDAGEWSGTFVGSWSMFDGSAEGTMTGWVWSHLFFGQINTTGTGESNWFIGLHRVNETDNTFQAGAIIFGEEQYTIWYAIGSL